MRDRIERAMAAWGRFVYRNAWATLFVVAALLVPLLSQLPKVKLDASAESFLHKSDPLMLQYDAFREQFGRDEMILIAIRPPEVFDLEFLAKLRSLHEALEEEVPRLQNVTSLVNARRTSGEGDTLLVGDLLDPWPDAPEALDDVRRYALSNPLYRDFFVSGDGRLTTILIETDAFVTEASEEDVLAGFDDLESAITPAERPKFIDSAANREIVTAVEAVVERYRAPDFEMHLGGSPIMMEHLESMMRANMARFLALAVAIIIGFLAFLFRRVAGVVLPLTVVVVSLAATLASMGFTEVPMTPPTQIIPVFLLAVGVGASIHVLAIFFQRRRIGEEPEAAIGSALGHSGLAILMTSLTTAGGLLSFSVADVAPIMHFGLFGPLGMAFCFVMTVVLLPALVRVFPISAPAAVAEDSPSQRALVRLGDWATHHAALVVLLAIPLIVLAVVGITRLRFEHDFTSWFPEDDPFRVANDVVNEELNGSVTLEVLVDTEEENGLYEPEVLRRMENLQEHALGIQSGEVFIGKAVSLVDISKEIHRALNEDRPEAYRIPDERSLVAQELLLFENSGSDDLEDFVDSRFQIGRMTFKLPLIDAMGYEGLLEELDVAVTRALGDELRVTMTGMVGIMGRTMRAVIESTAKSYLLALMIVTPLMMVLIGSVRIGLLSMVPNLTPIILTLGVMGWLDIPIDGFTLMVGSIALGLAVDDTIHFLHNFRRSYRQTGDVFAGIRETMRSTGQAMLFTTLVLSAGFAVFVLSVMPNLQTFGLLISFTVSMAFFADIVLTPALVALVLRVHERVTDARQAEAAS